METSEADRVASSSDESGLLNRNRSFKSKQLVRSQAIRESQSPPRTASSDDENVPNNADNVADNANNETITVEGAADDCVNCEKECSEVKKQPVEIQITPGAWEEPPADRNTRAKRWLSLGHRQNSRDLLSNNPRVACVCGACNACLHCRGRRRKQLCHTKQDSGISCSDDCPDCTDTDLGANDGGRKTSSLDVDDQATFYCRCPERKEKPKNASLSRTDSEEKSDPTGPELVAFIKDTLNKNARDRLTLLKIERELHALVGDTGRCIVRFPVMTSYGRMLVHRCAALFQLSHHLDQTNKTSVLVSKSGTSGGRIPCTSFKQWCTATFPPSPQRHQPDNTRAKSILKRDAQSLDETGAGSLNAARSKSLEQREKDYERVRRRIFSSDHCTQDESQWPWLTSGPVKLLTPDSGRNKLLKVQSLESGCGTSGAWRARGAVSKSHSFGGYGDEHGQHRVLSRQGDLASSSWRLSPSSSGYRTLSLHSTDSATPSPTGGASPEPGGSASNTAGVSMGEGVAVMWAITDLSAVPPGALVLHPQTGRPLTNPDGSPYHFDPANPPVLFDDQQQQCTGTVTIMSRSFHLLVFVVYMSGMLDMCSGELAAAGRSDDVPPIEDAAEALLFLYKTVLTPYMMTYDDGFGTVYNRDCEGHRCPDGLTCINNKCIEELKCDQRRGRLEKQHSFIDTDCECQPLEVTRDKCCSCECRRHDASQRSKDKISIETEAKVAQKPSSPTKNRYEKNVEASTNHNAAPEPPPNHRQQYESLTNQKPPIDPSTNQRQPYDISSHNYAPPNQRSQFESTGRQVYEQTNQRNQPVEQRIFENQRPPSFDANQKFEAANQRGQNEVTNHRPARVANQENQDAQQHNFHQGFRPDEMTSPQGSHTFAQPDPNMQAMAQAKVTPVPMPDPNMRPMSLTNVMYPPLPQGYPYMNHCRVEQPMQHVYPPMVQVEEQKQMPVPNTGNTFRIDPSYPYAAECAQCACADPAQHHHGTYNVPYGQVEVPPAHAALPPSYPLNNVILPQAHVSHYPVSYQDPLQWQSLQPMLPVQSTSPKLYVHEYYPVVYPNVYPQYNVMYPQVMPQPYPICQPMYPVVEKVDPGRSSAGHRQSKRNSISGSSRNTPLQTPPDDKKVPYEEPDNFSNSTNSTTHNTNPLSRQNSNEIAVKIQQIKDQMAQLNTGGRREGWRRNSGGGILGSYPQQFNGRVARQTSNDESQLSSAARAIVNSIRNMQAKNTYTDNRRPDYNNYRDRDKPDYRRRPDPPERPDNRTSPPDERDDRRVDFRNRNVPVPLQYRPPYLLRQMSPGTWCRRSPGPIHPVLSQPRRPHPDNRNQRR